MMFRHKSQSQRRKSQRRKSQSQRRKSQRRKSQRQRSKHNSYKGGNISLASQPFKSLGFGNGASSPREAALFHEQNSNDRQQQLNKMSGGKRSGGKRSRGKRSRGKRSRKQRGGNIEVPSFPPIGGINQAYSATDLSIGGNTSMVAGINDAQGDCFATDTCQSTTGGSKRTKRRKL
jgi:hypothetical protein